MRFLASMPELCDVTFLVGDTREPVCAVRAVLAARSRYSHPKYQLSARCPCRAQLVQPSKIAAECALSLLRAAGTAFQISAECAMSLPRAAGTAFQNISWASVNIFQRVGFNLITVFCPSQRLCVTRQHFSLMSMLGKISLELFSKLCIWLYFSNSGSLSDLVVRTIVLQRSSVFAFCRAIMLQTVRSS